MSKSLDDPKNNDNRDYDYSDQGFYVRAEFPIITGWINDGSKIVDLGCGNGSLIKYIQERKKVAAEGIEFSATGVAEAIKGGMKVSVGAIDAVETYKNYKDDEFDYAICNVTLQMVMYPEILLDEMKRISKYQIISFPNFAFFGNRLDLLFNGVMPRPMLHGYAWYNTGHIHQFSLKDFERFVERSGLKIIKERHLGCYKFLANIVFPNFFSKESIFLCEK